jgi:hypothetical protein
MFSTLFKEEPIEKPKYILFYTALVFLIAIFLYQAGQVSAADKEVIYV